MSAFSNFTITIPVPIAQGGTGAITAPLALVALGAAARGANADITNMSAVTQIQMGGTTSSFPALIQVSAGIRARLADNSDWAPFFCSAVNALSSGGISSFVGQIWSRSGTSDGIGIVFVDATASHPALKCSSTILQGRLADDSGFCPVQGLLRTAANATTGLVAGVLAATTNASIVITDASGQAYRVPCII